MPQRNTPERRDMLAARAEAQRKRSLSFTPPAGPREPMKHLPIIPAWMNRRTGEPHKHDRNRLRRLGGRLNVEWNNPNLVITNG